MKARTNGLGKEFFFAGSCNRSSYKPQAKKILLSHIWPGPWLQVSHTTRPGATKRQNWPSGWCIGLQSWLRGFDAQLDHLYDACTSLPQKSQAAIKWLEIRKKKERDYFHCLQLLCTLLKSLLIQTLTTGSRNCCCDKNSFKFFVLKIEIKKEKKMGAIAKKYTSKRKQPKKASDIFELKLNIFVRLALLPLLHLVSTWFHSILLFLRIKSSWRKNCGVSYWV